jgi:crotonobetainyl-CoA:carnitine CoA-transferase CaiB-like acyl-CoA transferase
VLADLGADVIKIEPLSGDPMRNTTRPAKVDGPLQGYDFQFDVDNRGKRSIAVDLGSDDGREIVHRLCTSADVFVCNLLQHRQERFGLTPARLWDTSPRLVHATLTGYGTDGADGDVPMARPAQGDHTAGLALVSGILAALRLVDRTGRGQAIETSLLEAAVWTLATDHGVTAVDRAPVRRRSRHQQIVVTLNRFPCGDGNWVVFNMPEASAWPRFCTALGLDRLLDDARFEHVRGRFEHMSELVDAIDDALSERSRDEWGVIFDEHGLIWGPVLGLHEVATDPQAEAIGLFPTIVHPERGEYRSVRVPMRFRDVDTAPKRRAPTLGEHTRSVLSSAGYDDDAIDRLVAEGRIAEPDG